MCVFPPLFQRDVVPFRFSNNGFALVALSFDWKPLMQTKRPRPPTCVVVPHGVNWGQHWLLFSVFIIISCVVVVMSFIVSDPMSRTWVEGVEGQVSEQQSLRAVYVPIQCRLCNPWRMFLAVDVLYSIFDIFVLLFGCHSFSATRCWGQGLKNY